MALKVSKIDLWMATIDDQPGGAARKLGPLSAAGADFEFVFTRRTPESPGKGLVVVTPVKGKKVTEAALAAGFAKPADMHSVRVEGSDKPGITAKLAQALGTAGISFRALSAAAIGSKFVTHIALDSADDAARAVSLLKKLG